MTTTGSPVEARGGWRASWPAAIAGAVILGCGLLVLLIAVLGVSAGRASFAGGSFASIERALGSDGLRICQVTDEPGGAANQATASRQYDVAFDCSGGATAQVAVDEYAHRDDRDAAVRNLEVLARPRGSGVAYTYGRFSIYLFGASDDQVQDAVNDALRGAGAR